MDDRQVPISLVTAVGSDVELDGDVEPSNHITSNTAATPALVATNKHLISAISMKYLHRTLLSTAFTLDWAHAATLDARGSAIDWRACETLANTSTTLDCAILPVPRDYSDTNSTATIDLKLARAKATKEPLQGSILFNPGGPGYAGRNALDGLGDTLVQILGGHYDVVSWDFRGTGETLPFSCFPTEAERESYNAQVLTLATNASDTAAGQTWSTVKWITEYCKNSTNATEVGELIGTAFTARDMMQIVDALGEDGLLHLWGVSYGSALGETAAAMFPDRVGRVLLDAVVNPTEWWAGRSISQVSDADKEFRSFCAECLATPELCPLAARASSGEELADKLYAMVEDAKHEPIVLGVLGLQTYTNIRTQILGALYEAAGFPLLSIYLDALLTRNETQFLSWATASASLPPSKDPFPEYSSAGVKENHWGIRCSDEMLRMDSLDEIGPLIDGFHAESEITGDITWTTVAMACAQWPFEAKERWTAGFHDIETQHPIMFLNNMYDPVTSVRAAQNASDSFVGSSLLINEGHGHSSLAQMSACTVKAIRAYFDNGTLPEPGTVCPATIPAFTEKTTADVLAVVDGEAA